MFESPTFCYWFNSSFPMWSITHFSSYFPIRQVRTYNNTQVEEVWQPLLTVLTAGTAKVSFNSRRDFKEYLFEAMCQGHFDTGNFLSGVLPFRIVLIFMLPGSHTTARYKQNSEVLGLSHVIVPKEGHRKRNYISKEVFDLFILVIPVIWK